MGTSVVAGGGRSLSSSGRNRSSKPGLKGRPWDKRGKHVAGQTWDTIVVGSGMGGMTTAALLSEIGEKVLVVEQHYTPGGFTHTFKRPGGYRWDVGVHAIGEVTEHALTGRLLKKLTKGRLEWASLGPVYDSFQFPDGVTIDFPDSPQQFRENLLALFPDEKEAILGYFEAVREVAGSMRRYYLSRATPAGISAVTDRLVGRRASRHFQRTASEVLSELTNNEKLKAVLAAQWGYYGAVPDDASFAIQALVAKHFLWGAYYPVGGSQRIAETMLATVAENGGWTRIASSVDELLVEDGAVVGVRVGEEEIRAKRVVSAIGAQATVSRLLPPSLVDESWAQPILDLEPAAAHVCLYLGFQGDIRQAGAGAANRWFYKTWDQTIESWRVDPSQEQLPDAPVLYCSFPSLKDPLHDPGAECQHTGEVVTFVPYKTFAKWEQSRWRNRDGEYDKFKERLKESLLRQFFEVMPELEPMLDVAEFSTPLSTTHFDKAIGGSIYGLSPTPQRYDNRWLRPRSPVANLYLAGCDTGAPGVIGAMFGGVLAALAARPVAVGRYMRDVF